MGRWERRGAGESLRAGGPTCGALGAVGQGPAVHAGLGGDGQRAGGGSGGADTAGAAASQKTLHVAQLRPWGAARHVRTHTHTHTHTH